MNNIHIDLVTSVQRSSVIREVTGKADGQLRGRGHIDVDVGTQGVGFLVDVVVETVSLIDVQDTSVLGERAGHIIGRNLASTANGNVCAVCRGIILEEHLVPVVGRVDVRIRARFSGVLDLVVRVHQVSERVTGGDGLIVGLHVGDRVGKLYNVGRLGDRGLDTCEDLRRAFLAALRGHEDDTIRSAGSVEGGRSGILHDREALDVVRLETGEVGGGKFDVVDEDQRAGVRAESGDTTHEEVGVVLARLT